MKQKEILKLSSDNKQTVMTVVNWLRKVKEGDPMEQELIGVLEDWRSDESYAPLWSMVALGFVGSRKAIPALLDVLDSDADYWCEAASEALVRIVQRHGEPVLEPIEVFIEKRLDHDPFDARLFAYEPIAQLKTSGRAKKFLIRMFEQDDQWQDSIAHDLANFGDKRILHLFRRAIEYAQHAGIRSLVSELREAYCVLDGVKFDRQDSKELWDQPWEERWSHNLDELGKTDDEIENFDKSSLGERLDKLESDDEFLEKIRKEQKFVANYPLVDFNLNTYLRIREPGQEEYELDKAIKFLDLSDIWSVEKIQLLINSSSHPEEVLNAVLANSSFTPSMNSGFQLFDLMIKLWNVTPREEFQGLNPEEIRHLDPHGIFNKSKLGRNELCYCGSGRKYKKCHGK
ncbi:MAG: hypothetical protein A2826_02730 [Candidatus Doudnabacteria bacterium RIFCSPHIGHO2_01_FULL_43_23]|uniref:Zinc chelation protein SecC n=1 Tax=Candidatus Doudnabacteria bacterium RIFCSPHIGHO2_01_FULL_43_23 TaxID=1817822 RepID=A0A1F5NRP6_9BACT|nr:MAG: hypothetical protein A2826_02730 [Candidatus Doudnabacteria bacterium RIFCSPHIGHO2_01_FULL_43_23]